MHSSDKHISCLREASRRHKSQVQEIIFGPVDTLAPHHPAPIRVPRGGHPNPQVGPPHPPGFECTNSPHHYSPQVVPADVDIVHLGQQEFPSSSSPRVARPRNPTPHQIFHLPPSATESDVKARYFDLVRIYHPDKSTTSISPELARERFQAITTAYDILRGKKPHPSVNATGSSGVQNRGYQTTAAYRAARKRRQELYSGGAVDDRWKDRIFLGLAAATVGVFVLQTFTTRREAMADIMMNARHTISYKSTTPEVTDGSKKPTKDEDRLSA